MCSTVAQLIKALHYDASVDEVPGSNPGLSYNKNILSLNISYILTTIQWLTMIYHDLHIHYSIIFLHRQNLIL